MALSTAMCIAVMIKSLYLSRSLVDRCPEKSADPSASSSVDSNTSRSVWSNLYLVWLVNVFLCEGVSIEFLWVGDRCPFFCCLRMWRKKLELKSPETAHP